MRALSSHFAQRDGNGRRRYVHRYTTSVSKSILGVFLTLSVLLLVGCGGTANSSTPAKVSNASSTTAPTIAVTQASSTSTEQPVPVAGNTQASGSDIPDTQAFTTYTSTSGKYQLEIPEGWARTVNGMGVTFASALNSLQVTRENGATQPTAQTVPNAQAAILEQTGRAIRDMKIKTVQLPAGSAVLLTYTANSDPNSVTGKQVRLENNRYLFFQNGMLATLTLAAPVGADNVDQWSRIAHSFKWT